MQWRIRLALALLTRALGGCSSLAATTSFLHATEGGVAGMVHDYCTYARPWVFEVGDVAAPVHLWHGLARADYIKGV